MIQTAHVSKLSGIVFAREVAIHRGSKDAGGFVCSVSGSLWIATGFALGMTRVVRYVMRGGTVSAFFSLFSLHSSLFKSPRSVRLAPRGYRPAWAKTFLASHSLAFLETNTEAKAAAAVARGAVVALS